MLSAINLKVMLSAVKENKAGEREWWFGLMHWSGRHIYVRIVTLGFPDSEVIFWAEIEKDEKASQQDTLV